MMKKRNEEKGIALVMAIMVALFLLSIGLVFFTYSQKSIVDANCSSGKRLGMMVAESGAERALWQIQQILDNGGTVTTGNLFGDYNNLYAEHRNSELANTYGSSSVGMGYNTKYAVKIEWEQQNEYLAIYSLGVLRVANPLAGKSATLIEGGKILIKVGRRQQEFANIAIGSPGSLDFSANSQRQITGDGATIVSEGAINMNSSGINSNALLDKWIDGNINNIESTPLTIITTQQQIAGLSAPGITTNADGSYSIGNKSIIIQTGVATSSLPALPDLDLSQYSASADYRYDPTAGNGTGDIVDKNGVRMNWVPKAGNIIESPPEGVVTFWGNTSKPTANDIQGYLTKVYNLKAPYSDPGTPINDGLLKTAFYDVNGDGFTTIYVPEGGPNLRILPKNGSGGDAVGIVNGAKSLIVSQGMGNNFNVTDNPRKAWPSLYHLPANRPYAGEGSGYGVDATKTTSVSIEVRGRIIGVNYIVGTGSTPSGNVHLSLIDQADNNPLEGWINSDTGAVTARSWAVQPAERGSLSFLAENDLILSSAGANEGVGNRRYEGEDPINAFKGFLYSKRDLTIQIDLLLLGSMIGLRNINMPDLKTLDSSLSMNIDGGALNLHFVNPKAYLPPTQDVDMRKLQIVSWESGKIKI